MKPLTHVGWWYVIAVTGASACSKLVPGFQLHETMHELLCGCEKPWKVDDLVECSSEGVAAVVMALDEDANWSHEYPDGSPTRHTLECEEGRIEVMRLFEAPRAARKPMKVAG